MCILLLNLWINVLSVTVGRTLLSIKNYCIGLIKSTTMSQLLCVIPAGMINFDGPPQFRYSSIEWDSGITVSACPWMISVGHWTCSMSRWFSNLSRTISEAKVPSSVFTACLSEVYGDMRTRADMDGYSTARAQQGPEPMDRPIRIMSFWL